MRRLETPDGGQTASFLPKHALQKRGQNWRTCFIFAEAALGRFQDGQQGKERSM